MKCPASGGDWCVYSVHNHCWWKGAPNEFSAEKCLGAQLIPCQPSDAEFLFGGERVYSEGDKKAQRDVLELVISKAIPTDSLNPISRAECSEIKSLCEYYLNECWYLRFKREGVRNEVVEKSNEVGARVDGDTVDSNDSVNTDTALYPKPPEEPGEWV